MSKNKPSRMFLCPNCGTKSVHKQISLKSSRAYSIYNSMRSRCLNKNAKNYERYGGRGIKICDRWLESFDNFFEDMGEPPSLIHSIERIDNDDIYSFDNCYWAIPQEQAMNRRNTIQKGHFYLEYNGKKQNLTQWSIETGIDRRIIKQRIKNNWPIKKILTTPSLEGRNQFGDDGVQYTCFGKTQSLKKWSLETGVSVYALRARILKYQWPLERAFTEKKIIGSLKRTKD